MKLIRTALLAGLIGAGLAGCASYPDDLRPGVNKPLPSAVVAQSDEQLSPATVHRLLNQSITYHLGPGDVVSVSVYLHPDLSAPAPGVTSSGLEGALVSNDGNIQLPLLGVVHVEGMTTDQLRAHLTKLYAQYVIDPKVTVQLQVAHSIRYYLLGEFTKPGLVYSDRPVRLLEAMALGGSVDLANADLRGAYVVQNGRKLPVNFHALVIAGDLQQNIPLRSGDTVVVPSVSSMKAFVFGAVKTPGPVPFVDGRLSLLQALSDAGMDTTQLTLARLSDIRVIRSEGTTGQFYVVNARKILEGQAAPFYLKSGDIVFVPQTTISSWNQAIQLLLPSLQAISTLLQPFVSIKFLSQ
ncbi:polysaccharide biosynthesis/export family protein [Acidithiobacillus sp. YTS05]|uniref:Polysaccharide biosynthesis protein n=1 Tax=Igneacidithiobacillus copahuensis TaxID=2724909 RepID=A0AAE3CJQ1_9PROT|nr:polysaccharide biosynthesis/export family protein [Igneacidithiobacillus copahuensis]MBU2788017.1 polysaccharide biosynthesis protein [Igneacidithiobacillus copahuensis]MBU2796611.1 polysaccharide biosynthesis protein [Acidithiobacillus sp. VAN18-2]UTV81289.1 polysaccharide biosynthesis/export family protein [Acidithiobacillus sp. YTS05]